PFDRTDDPGSAEGRQVARGWIVEQERGVGMLLQEAGRDAIGDRPLDRPLHRGGLVFAEAHQHDLAGVENGADAHRDGLLGYVLLAEEAAGRVLARHRIERDQARAAMARRAGFVEADVPGAANAEDLQVDAAGPANALFVAGAIILDLL